LGVKVKWSGDGRKSASSLAPINTGRHQTHRGKDCWERREDTSVLLRDLPLRFVHQKPSISTGIKPAPSHNHQLGRRTRVRAPEDIYSHQPAHSRHVHLREATLLEKAYNLLSVHILSLLS
ncbi:hypothetical protein KUCAC02_029443, partial [Chaenocephalus aceratus]